MTVWIDTDNAPHALLMAPIVRALERRGNRVVVTARLHGPLVEMLEAQGISPAICGAYPGKRLVSKVVHVMRRAICLSRFLRKERPAVGLSHGTRAAMIAARLTQTPFVTMLDYEHSNMPARIVNWSAAILVPRVADRSELVGLGYLPELVATYDGLKEELYVYGAAIDQEKPSIWQREDAIHVLLRPPADTAHYFRAESTVVFRRILDRLSAAREAVECVVVPRSAKQSAELQSVISRSGSDSIRVLNHVVDGPTTIRSADLVIGGGGTMNREAACIGVPAFSTYAGRWGGVDRYLEQIGRLTNLVDDTQPSKLMLRKQHQLDPLGSVTKSAKLLREICDLIERAGVSEAQHKVHSRRKI